MPQFRTDTIQRQDSTGRVLASDTVQVDITAEVNADTLRSRSTAALVTNATYLAIASPTVAQNTAQVKALTKQIDALIRLDLSLLSTIADT